MVTTKSLFFSLLCSIVSLASQQATAQYNFCFNETGNYTLDSTYHDNLNHLLATLPSSQNGNGYGFYDLSYGNSSDQVNGIGQCRGDTMPDVCQSCLHESARLLQERCPYQKKAAAWYENCMLHYSNSSLLGVMETYPQLYLYVGVNVSSNIIQEYLKTLRNLLDNLKNRAAAGGSLKKFAVENVTAPRFKTIYGFVQCTPDLDQTNCTNCLEQAFEVYQNCCVGQTGASIFGTSCRFRYEDRLFYNSTTADVPPPSPPGPPPPSLPSTKARTIVIVVASSTAVFAGIIISACVCLKLRRAKKLAQTNHLPNEPVEEMVSEESFQYSFETIKLATDNFSEENKLGQGGFGVVYRGRFSNGQDIAVKKLSRGSYQGGLEFKNEVMLVAKLQHRNLVRLLGFSLEGSERLLVYEFVQNGSLDHFIFDERKRANLDWDSRYKIIGGVARGLLYLHEDSRLRIIHRDLKASNILLDDEMHPKISDFGTARLFDVDQTQESTSRVVGTYGYMAPEYVMHGQFSVKSDVFSFGVLLLEIISGKKINYFQQEDDVKHLLSYTWKHWREGNATNIVDPLMKVGSASEIMTCIHIGLLCVQENLVDRPTMNTVLLMLNSSSVSFPLPSKPAFFMYNNMGSDMALPSQFNSRINHSKSVSVNETSISELSAR
ncbi:cysteine-rich receptor-like protein kinase 44 isoform X2 [Humulus lupulus]|uniref:cysteine-rich receptor-like protein kinase 44 isoform X2 n=1 Tax=Humulus lupulus TaxID=3486 RepID=UPI002B402D93|nr:cysteine-rich receptor-like protein kinase 44 isoform X2 [Humulus lupulus]